VSVFGIDHAWGRPSISAMQNAGVHFVARYLSFDVTGKTLDPAEAKRLSDAGIEIVVVWESTASRALAGYGAGKADAYEAAKQAKNCGMPSGRPIYFAVDFDAAPGQEAAISAYLDGVASVIGRGRVGIYGGLSAVTHALDGKHATYAWQTYAWSHSTWDTRAHIQQYSNGRLIGGVDCDFDRAMKADYGQWRVGISPTPTPPPTPTPTEDDMPYGQLAEGQHAITPISLPRGRYKTIGFTADNGLQNLPPAQLRVAVYHGGGTWKTDTITVDSSKDQTVVTFTDPGNTSGISVRREDAGDVHVAWEVS
jgi:hypothetical protein